MHCDKKEFLSAIDPWRGKLCIVTITSELLNGILALRLKALSADGILTFSGDSPEKLEFDLSLADSFEFGDARMADESIREQAVLVIDAMVSARVTGRLLVGIMLLRDKQD